MVINFTQITEKWIIPKKWNVCKNQYYNNIINNIGECSERESLTDIPFNSTITQYVIAGLINCKENNISPES